MNIDRIIIKDSIRKDTGDIRKLAEDIRENGLINPIIINTDFVLLSGYRRYLACKMLGMKDVPVRMVVTNGEEKDLIIEGMDDRFCKPLSAEDYQEYEKVLRRIESAKAEERMKAGAANLRQNSDEGRTDETVAKQTGIGSHDMLRKAQKITVIQQQLALPAEEVRKKEK